MTDKQINKWLRHRFSAIGWVLVGYYLLVNLLALTAMAWEAVRQMRMVGISWWKDMNMDSIVGNAWGYITAIIVFFVILHAWKGPDYWGREVLVKEKSMKASVFFSTLCLCMGTQLINSLWVSGLELLYNRVDKSLMPLLEEVSGDSDTFSMFLYAAILAPVAEELLFRGYVLRALRPYGKLFAIYGSAFLFGAFHGNLLQTPYAFLMGLLFGYVTVEYSILWAIALHMFNNLILADLITRLTGLLPLELAGAIHLILFGAGAVVSGIVLITKRQEISAYLRSEWMDRRVLKCFFANSGIIALTVLMIVNVLMLLP